MNFKIGDVVQLKSGGPLMTIEEIGTYSGKIKALCIWFEGGKKEQQLFSLETIVRVD